jgi:uncharacterized membrane protein
MKIIWTLGILLVVFLIVTNVNALQEVAGPIVIPVTVGSTNSSSGYGLINDENETITVSLRAEGNIAKYLSFPNNVSLEPKKIVYINLTASLPSDYQGGNITGLVFALQEGNPGQVKINIQMMKNVTILVLGQKTFPYIEFIIVALIMVVVFIIGLIMLNKKRKGG